MATSSKRPIAVFPIGKLKKIGDFILKIRAIILNIVSNPTIFVTPSPTTLVVTTNTTGLESAEALAQTRVVGAVSARNLKYTVVLKNIHGIQSYVQTLADNAPDEATAIAIISASGFDLKNKGVRVKPLLSAKNGAVSGTVALIAKSAGKRASYNWRQSIDNVAWTDLPPSLQAKTTVIGLTRASVVYFQYRAITIAGPGNWSMSVSLLIQ